MLLVKRAGVFQVQVPLLRQDLSQPLWVHSLAASVSDAFSADASVETAAEVASPGEVAPRASPLATSPLLQGGGGGGASLLDDLAAVLQQHDMDNDTAEDGFAERRLFLELQALIDRRPRNVLQELKSLVMRETQRRGQSRSRHHNA